MHYALIKFLNARPLWWGLTNEPQPGETFEFTSPARCADLLADGHADLGLIPAIELQRIPNLVAMPSVCIASRSEVRSVLLFSKVPFEEIRSVALDPASRTSVTLARILIAERLGEARYRQIRFDPVESDRLLTLEGHDALVVIGDPALRASKLGGMTFRYDLVSEWRALFGEPFVFAVWAGRRDVFERNDPDAVLHRLEQSLAYGFERLTDIARQASEELSLPYDELIDYFRTALHYEFGENEQRALARFYSLAAKYLLIDEPKDIEWIATRTSKRS